MYEKDYDLNSRHTRQPKNKVVRAECPGCFNSVTIGARPRVGQLVVCSSCKSDLEVVWLSPIELDFPFDDEDSFEEDEEDEY